MKRLLTTLLFLAFCFGSKSLQAQNLSPQEDRPPNFVIIMADDLGYGDISPFGGWIETPFLNQMADEGMRFTNFYASGPVCSPTRAGLLTGRYQQRAGIPGVVYAAPNRNRHHGLQQHELTFAEALKNAGYKTGMFGKWHLGYEPQYNPVHHGFDEYRGYVSGNVDYFAHVDQAGFYDWWAQDQLVNEPGYVTHLINQHAVDFIERNKDHPFVLYLPHEAPHYPYQGPEDEAFRIVHAPQAKVQMDSSEVMRAYREMVQEMDSGVGAVMQALENLNLKDNTLVFFFSDNGATRSGSNGKLRGHKGSLWEGGIRVPAIAWWNGKITAGATTDQQAISIDVMPTLLGLAGLEKPANKLDGMDLSDVLQNDSPPSQRTLFWDYNNQSAIRAGDWKLLQNRGDAPSIQLFNLRDSIYEGVDVAAQFQQRVDEMLNKHLLWKSDVTTGATRQPEKEVED